MTWEVFHWSWVWPPWADWTRFVSLPRYWKISASAWAKPLPWPYGGNHGATVVRLLEAGGPITVALRAGTVLPLASSATGRAFAAFSAPYLRQLLEVEIKANAESNGTTLAAARREMDGLLSEIRNQGIARASGSYSPGINGFSAPVFNQTGTMVAAITSLGPIGNFASDWDSNIAAAIRQAAQDLSHRLGYHEPGPA